MDSENVRRGLEKDSRAIFEFSLEWAASGVRYCDTLWADPVNMWRDVFIQDVAAALHRKNEGETLFFPVKADSSPFNFNKGNLVTISPQSFHPPGKPEELTRPHEGRFYPQAYLHGAPGVFQVSIKPARYLGQDNHRLHFDLSHPLAGYDLQMGIKIIHIHESKTERGGRCEDWLEKTGSDGPGMQVRYRDQLRDFFYPEAMRRQDESEDTLFYGNPRMVQHLDSSARETIRDTYGQLIAPGSRVLDLMGSWDSHLPANLNVERLSVIGMNAEELSANIRATDTLLHDLNSNSLLPFEPGSFDAVICTASVEYLTDPFGVFAEIKRILRPGGLVALSFSNRWFPPKAIALWSQLHEFERLGMVMEMLQRTADFSDLGSLSRRGLPRADDDPHWELPYGDPVYMAWGRKNRT